MFNIDSEVNSNSLLNSFLTKNQMKIMHIVFGSDVLDWYFDLFLFSIINIS